jgi:GTP diphosphokinase / guanosine-3',5'-bis(diphosphate) 3'-diphosphatase
MVDLTAGPSVPLGTPVGPRHASVPDGSRTSRLRSMLPWQSTAADPVGELVRAHKSIHSQADAGLVRRGYAVAERMHRGQIRKSGEPYITHPLAVAHILAALGMDTTTLVAALLHDTVEDTSYTLPELRNDFGSEVALLVDGVTKFDKVYFGDIAEAETIRKMLVRAGQDVRVLVIKLADRLHNMRTLAARSPASRTRIASATQEVLVPLCDRLGIQALKRELEDSVLLNLEPASYAAIDEHVRNRPDWRSYLDTVIGTLQPRLAHGRISVDV